MAFLFQLFDAVVEGSEVLVQDLDLMLDREARGVKSIARVLLSGGWFRRDAKPAPLMLYAHESHPRVALQHRGSVAA